MEADLQAPGSVLCERETARLDRAPFFPSPETSSSSLSVGAYVFIGVGAVTMVMGFLGCVGAVNEVRCLLGLVSRPSALPTQPPEPRPSPDRVGSIPCGGPPG